MNKRQKLITKVVKEFSKQEEFIYGKKFFSFYRMRKFVKKYKFI